MFQESLSESDTSGPPWTLVKSNIKKNLLFRLDRLKFLTPSTDTKRVASDTLWHASDHCGEILPGIPLRLRHSNTPHGTLEGEQ